ncbi:MAG: hypothetical protein P8J65_00965 [Candidatus Actinomarina sp.]|nr:hypothetical protein [Candidatus Actinomarina sp.]MDG2082343.1 hypothetical protein [Candidatus Actinomarina sp.]
MNNRILMRIIISAIFIIYLFVSDGYLARRLVQLPELLLNNF